MYLVAGMVSRRALLLSGGSSIVGGFGLAAAWTASRETETGIVYNKYVSVLDDRGQEQPLDFDALRLMYANESDTVHGQLLNGYTEAYTEPATLQVDDKTHRALDERFAEVTYRLVFEQAESATGPVSRADFNRVSLGDSVEVATDRLFGPTNTNQVTSVTRRDIPIDEMSVAVFTEADR